MAMATTSQQVKKSDLKYLGFVEVALLYFMTIFADLYDSVKERSGALKTGIDFAENTVKAVLDPVFEAMEGKPHEALLCLDKKVDAVVKFIAPYLMDSPGVQNFVDSGPMGPIVNNFQRLGVYKALKYYYLRLSPATAEYAYHYWQRFLSLPYTARAVYTASFPTLFFADNFNKLLNTLRKTHLPLTKFMPSLPLDSLENLIKMEPRKAIRRQNPWPKSA